VSKFEAQDQGRIKNNWSTGGLNFLLLEKFLNLSPNTSVVLNWFSLFTRSFLTWGS